MIDTPARAAVHEGFVKKLQGVWTFSARTPTVGDKCDVALAKECVLFDGGRVAATINGRHVSVTLTSCRHALLHRCARGEPYYSSRTQEE
jgi:hypothetical protein